jgi:hypothetical protein
VLGSLLHEIMLELLLRDKPLQRKLLRLEYADQSQWVQDAKLGLRRKSSWRIGLEGRFYRRLGGVSGRI